MFIIACILATISLLVFVGIKALTMSLVLGIVLGIFYGVLFEKITGKRNPSFYPEDWLKNDGKRKTK